MHKTPHGKSSSFPTPGPCLAQLAEHIADEGLRNTIPRADRATSQTAMTDKKLARWASLRYLIHASAPFFASSFTDFHYGP